MAKKITRKFKGTRKKVPFTHETTTTDAAALLALAQMEGSFPRDCAFEIGKMVNKMSFREGHVAWGFRLADEGPRKSAVAVQLPATVAASVGYRKPLKAITPAGNLVKISLCGDGSKRPGDYSISNGGAYKSPENVFYGFMTPGGEWAPTDKTPEGIVEFLKNF